MQVVSEGRTIEKGGGRYPDGVQVAREGETIGGRRLEAVQVVGEGRRKKLLMLLMLCYAADAVQVVGEGRIDCPASLQTGKCRTFG